MKKKKLLQQDAASGLALPFNSAATRLQLSGFLLPYKNEFPSAVPMMCSHEGKDYVITQRGEAFSSPKSVHGETRVVDLPLMHTHVAVGPSLQQTASPIEITVGMVAFALSAERIFFGPSWAVRKALRQELAHNDTLNSKSKTGIRRFLASDAQETLAVRAWLEDREPAHETYHAVREWAQLSKPKRAEAQAKTVLTILTNIFSMLSLMSLHTKSASVPAPVQNGQEARGESQKHERHMAPLPAFCPSALPLAFPRNGRRQLEKSFL